MFVIPKKKCSFLKATISICSFYIIADVLDNIFQVTLLHMMMTEEWRIYYSIHSLIRNTSMFFIPLSILICREIVISRDNQAECTRLCRQILKISMLLITLICILEIIFYLPVSDKMKPDSIFLWGITLLTIGAADFYTVLHGMLQGLNRFRLYGLAECTVSFVQFILGILSIKIEMGVEGIIYAIFTGNMVIIGILFFCLKDEIKICGRPEKTKIKTEGIVRSYGIIFVTSALYSFYINSGEVIFIERLFDEELIKEYAIAATLGKISLYITSAVSVVLFPTIICRKKEGRDTNSLFLKVMAWSLTLSMAYGCFLLVFGKRLILLFFGERYGAIWKYISSIVIFTIPLGALPIIQYYFMGIGKLKRYACMLGMGTATALGAIGFVHPDIMYVPVILGMALYAIIVGALLYVCKAEL